jgi:hypothetical protein
MLPEGLQIAQSPQPITYQKVLLVEGHDAFQFFKALLRHLNLLSDIEIRNFGGIDELDFLETLKITDGFDQVIALAIIRDAERNANTAFNSVCRTLEQTGFDVPLQPMTSTGGAPKISVYILPDCINNGALEHLCLQIVREDPAIPCVSQFFECIQSNGIPQPRNMHKANLHAFLSSRQRPNLRLGEAAHAGYWPWENAALDQLKQFLNNI